MLFAWVMRADKNHQGVDMIQAPKHKTPSFYEKWGLGS
jgi:hypothetical protein